MVYHSPPMRLCGEMLTTPCCQTPMRFQRQRTKGWRMPNHAVFVGRPTKWGNPFRVCVHGTASECVQSYREAVIRGNLYVELNHLIGYRLPMADVIEQLRGFHLVCWCRLDQPCHADVLLEFANA